MFPHHESEIAQSTIAHGHAPVRYWMHNNMITINGKKMGKSYNNVIKLSELFEGTHPILQQAYHPMVVRFYILQTHYRSTLDFSNEALQASERAFKRLWEAYENLKKLPESDVTEATDANLNKEVALKCSECADFMNDDFNTAKVIANLFDLAPTINSLKSGQISRNTISGETLKLLKATYHDYLERILGMAGITQNEDAKLHDVLTLMIKIRGEARARKDFATSDQIRNDLAKTGIMLKDEKDGTVTYTIE